MAPVKVRVTFYHKKLTDLCTQICSIIGGVFAVAGLIESFTRNLI